MTSISESFKDLLVPALEAVNRGMEKLDDWIRSPRRVSAELARKPVEQDFANMGTQPSGLDRADAAAAGPGPRGTTVTTGNINVTVNVTQPTNASPQEIGAAAGNAIGSALRGVMGDTPSDLGRMAVP